MNAETEALITVLIRSIASGIIVAVYFAFFGRIWYRTPLYVRRIALCALFISAATIIRSFQLVHPVLALVIMLPAMLSPCLLYWRQLHGLKLLFCTVSAIVSEFLLEYIDSALFFPMVQDQIYLANIAGKDILTFKPWVLPAHIMFLSLATTLVLSLQYLVRNRIRSGRPVRMNSFFVRMLLVSALVAVLAVVLSRSMNALYYRAFTYRDTNDLSSLPNPAFYIPMLVLLLFFWESYQQYRLYQNNRALVDRNRAYQNILDSTREFRHNIVNLIYGFEGMILSGNQNDIQDYYAELSRRCILNNNENANALNHIDNPVLTALLLRKLDRASEMEIPLYVTVDEGFSFGDVPPAPLADVIGNLLDNALEAANRAENPRVDIMLLSVPLCDTILIDNTYAPDADLSFLTGDAHSSKPNHQATGLSSVRKTIARYPEICLNHYQRGRYIDTSLCVYRQTAQ